jgi:outer membrane protein TolC
MMLLLSFALAKPMTLDQALTLAEEANPEISGASYDLQAAEARATAARGTFDPYFSLEAGRGFNVSEGSFGGFETHTETTSVLWNATLGQTLPTGTSWSMNTSNSSSLVDLNILDLGVEDGLQSRGSAGVTLALSQQVLEGHRMAYNLESVRQAEAARGFADARLQAQRQTVMLETSRAYYELVYADAALGVARRAVEVATEERRIVDAQVKAGNLAPVEATRVKAAVAQAELAVLDAENARAAANDVLASWVGDVGETFEPGNASGPTTSLSIDADRAVEAALSGNPGLNLARLQVDNAEMSLVASRHAMLPSLSLDARVGYSGFAQVTDGTRQDGAALSRDKLQTGDFPDRYVGATFTVPLGMRAERGAVGADIAEIGSAQSSLLSQENALALQVMGLVRTLETAQQRVALAELNLQLARETLAAEKARQQAGRAVQKDVLEAQRAVSDAEVQLLRARTDFEKALVELQALQGKL